MKSQLKLLLFYELNMKGFLFDPKIAAWLLNPDENKEKSLLDLVTSYIGKKHVPELIRQKIHSNPKIFNVLSCYYSFSLMEKLMDVLKSRGGQWDLFTELEMKIVPILAKLEFVGIGFNDSKCQNQRSIIENTLTCIEKKAHIIAGSNFSLSSPAEVAEILFIKLKLPVLEYEDQGNLGKRKKNSTHPSTSNEVLVKLKNLVIHLIYNLLRALYQF